MVVPGRLVNVVMNGALPRRLLLRSAPLAFVCLRFPLRGAWTLRFQLYINASDNSTLGNELKRSIASAAAAIRCCAELATTTADGCWTCCRTTQKVVVGLNASGQVREFQLRIRFQFRCAAATQELIIPTEILQQRDISFNETAVLAKGRRSLLYRDMQTDIVQQLMRRLAP